MTRVTTIIGLLLTCICAPALAHIDLTPEEVQALLDSDANVVILDVREEIEFCDSTYVVPGHIPGAINMPWNSEYLQDHYGELSPLDSTIVVCRSGNRSNQAANFLDGVGFVHVFDMLGGMNAWQGETENCFASSTPGVEGIIASGIALGPAAPNPFRVQTELSYVIPAGPAHDRITIRIYDTAGRLVSELIETSPGPGTHRAVWDGNDGEGRPVRSGVYHYQLAWNGQTATRRVVLLR